MRDDRQDAETLGEYVARHPVLGAAAEGAIPSDPGAGPWPDDSPEQLARAAYLEWVESVRGD